MSLVQYNPAQIFLPALWYTTIAYFYYIKYPQLTKQLIQMSFLQTFNKIELDPVWQPILTGNAEQKIAGKLAEKNLLLLYRLVGFSIGKKAELRHLSHNG